jgi:hypothetical protein
MRRRMTVGEREWDLLVDNQIDDEAPPRIDDVDWGKAEKFGLDALMVGLATGTGHRDAKIGLSQQLIDIHKAHLKVFLPNNTSGLLPEKILDRLVYGMITACAETGAVPNALLHLLSMRMKISHRPQGGIQDEVAYRNLLYVVAENSGIGKRKAAKAVGISPTTAAKWMGRTDFKEFVSVIKKNGIKRVS